MKGEKTSSRRALSPGEPTVLRDAAVAAWGRVVTVRDAKAHLSALLEWVAAGHELTITSDGLPKARLISATTVTPRKVFRGMGHYLQRQPVHGGPEAEAIVQEDRDARGW